MFGFVFFRNAGTDEDRLCAGNPFFDIDTVCLHRGNDVRQIFQRLREMLLNQQVDRVTAGGDDNIPSVFLQHPFVFFLDNGCTDCGFFHIIESELFERFTHGIDADSMVIGKERRRKADDYRFASLKKNFYLFQLTCDFFCILRTHNKALSAENTFISDNVRLISRKTDRLYRTVADTLVTVFAVRFLKRKTIGHIRYPPFPSEFLNNLFFEKFFEIFARNAGVDLIVYLYGYADTVALSDAEAADQSDAVSKVFLFNRFLKKFHDFRRTFQMAGTAYTNLYNHDITPLRESLC